MKHQILQIPRHSANRNKNVTTWALPEGSIQRLGEGRITDLAFSKSGDYLACGTSIGLWWYELATLSPMALWEAERGMISAVAFSACGEWLAVGNTDGIVKVWNVKRGICVTQTERPERRRAGISRLAFSTDGQYLAASTQRNDIVHLWHVETGHLFSLLSANSEIRLRSGRKPRPLIFSPASCLLACASPEDANPAPDFISIWDVSTGERLACLRGHTEHVYALSFSPCGQLLASGDSAGTLREWDISTGKQVRVSSEYDEKYQAIPAYTSSGELRAAGAYEYTITIWDVERHEKLDTFEHRGNISVMCFSNGTHLAVASDFDFKVWQLGEPSIVSDIPIQSDIPIFLTFSSDSQRLASVGGGAVTCWNVATQQPRRIRRANTRIRSVSILEDGSLHALGTYKGKTLSVWNVETNETIATLKAHEKSVNEAAFSSTGRLWASGDIEGTVYVWDGSGKQTACKGHTESIQSLAFSSDEKRLASASRDKTARVWDVASGEELTRLSLTSLLEDKLYKGDSREIQKLRESVAIGVSTVHRNRIEALAFSPCSHLLAGGLFKQIRLWDVRTYDVVMSILLPLGCYYPFALAFSPCGQYLASGSWWQGTDKVSIRLWDIATGENVATFWGHSTDVQDLVFSPDGTLLASGGFDGTILLWDMKPYL